MVPVRRAIAVGLAGAAFALGAPFGLATAAADTSRAGVATVDASWHIGASGGQFSSDEPPFSEEMVDPHHHSTKKRPAYGLGSRVSVRALVVEDPDGERLAIVAHDLYLPQDLLTRRIATLVEGETGIPAENVAVTASHNHNSAFYSTPGWGTWLFQDVFDLRFFEYMAKRSAAAVAEAADGLVPVRMGGATSTFNEIASHTYGPQVADDGTPAGQPWEHTTGDLSVVAFDDISDPERPEPLATWVVFGVHPEWTWGYDLLNGDISHAAMRIIDRESGGVTVWSGREIGTSGPHKDTRVHPPEARREYQDNGFAQIDRAARLLADAVAETRAAIAAGEPEDPDRFAPYAEGFEVAAASERFAPPATRPYPGVSNCNTAALFHGDPRLPILGLPDCTSAPVGPLGEAIGPIGGEIYEQLKDVGVPIPESYSPTKLTAVEETAAVHLMALRLGDIGVTVCPCEQFTDTALNIESRIDRAADNLWIGWNWADQKTPSGRDWCVEGDDGTWTCADPRAPGRDLEPVSERALRRAIAQIENDASGWETDLATLGSEAEPADPDEIKGNFTHEEFPEHGFALPIAVGMGNDYWGYVPEYREYRAHDHYRKALSGLGPHGADFLATRLARLAVSLNGGPGPEIRPLDVAYQAESARAEAMAETLGELGTAYEDAYQASLPADAGESEIVDQLDEVALFSAAHVSWVGGSTYADIPEVRVERRVDGEWAPFADTDGEVQLTVRFPRPEELADWRAGQFEWRWTAAFEAFGSDVALPDATGEARRRTPLGTYRFVISGQRRAGTPAALSDYEIVGEPFEVVPWDGVEANDLRLEPDGTVSFEVGPVTTHEHPSGKVEVLGPIDLPDSYESPFRYIDDERRVFTYGLADADRHQVYCSFCSFRPWADTSEVASATVTFERPGGRRGEVSAAFDPATERWRTSARLRPNQSARVETGGVVDSFGNFNGAPSGVVERAAGQGPGGGPG
jgi:hypothetical protein